MNKISNRTLKTELSFIVQSIEQMNFGYVKDIVNQILDRVNEYVVKQECKWKLIENDCYYETECKEAQYFDTGNIKDNKYKFCPYCGGKICNLKMAKPNEKSHLNAVNMHTTRS